MLSTFEVTGLHGHKNIKVDLQNDRVILVGENGSGKTTLLRMLYYFLSGQWPLLHSFRFETIRAVLGGESVSLDRVDVEAGLDLEEIVALRQVPPGVRRRMKMAIQEVRLGKTSPGYLEELATRWDIPLHIVFKQAQRSETLFSGEMRERVARLDKLRSAFADKIVYLPTYRRIEEEFHLVVRDRRIEEAFDARRPPVRHERQTEAIELIEFGMHDVSLAIERTAVSLKEFARQRLETLTLGYLGEILDRRYQKVDFSAVAAADEGAIGRVLDRIDPRILSPEQKHHVRKTVTAIRERKRGPASNEHDKMICHYFLKLLAFQKELEEREGRIKAFAEVCNTYFDSQQKRITYDSTAFGIRIEDVSVGAELNLQDLSSGEKQIVSLFGHLYLSWGSTFFLIIDEPELSLSVPWQRTFLRDLSGAERCAGFAAATHSPFIYDNELSAYARGLGELTVIRGRRA